MPKLKDGYIQISTQIPASTVARFEAVIARTGRSLAEEIAHAMERHADYPPTVIVDTPPLESAAVRPGAGHKKRGPRRTT